jgi:hypothetical protein
MWAPDSLLCQKTRRISSVFCLATRGNQLFTVSPSNRADMKNDRHSDRPSHDSAPAWLLVVPLAVTFVLLAIGAFLPGKRLWGINHLAFYPAAARVAMLAGVACFFVPFIGRSFYELLVKAFDFVRSRGSLAVAIVALVSMLSFGAFVAFQSSTLLLGDGQLLVNTFESNFFHEASREETHASHTLASDLRAIAKTERIAPGAMALYYLAAAATRAVGASDPIDGVRFLNCLLGGILVFVLLRGLLRSAAPPALVLWTTALTFAGGAVQLFFGYVEFYTPLFFFGALYVLSSFGVLRGSGSLWLCAVLFLLTALSHVQGVLLFPSFAFLIMWRCLRRDDAPMRLLTPAMLAASVVAFWIAWAFTPLSRFYLPMFETKESYGVFSWDHAVDIFNELLLLQPVFLLFVVMGVTGWWLERRSTTARDHKRGTNRSQEDAVRGFIPGRVAWHFAWLLLAPALVFLILFKPEIGMGRDWDLFSITSLGLTVLFVLIFSRFEAAGRPAHIAATGGLAIVLCLVATRSWIGINATPTRAAARYEQILQDDRSRLPYAYESLAMHYDSKNHGAEVIRIMEAAIEISKNPRQMFLLSNFYRKYGDNENSMRLLRETLRRRPRYAEARQNLLALLTLERGFAEAVDVARAGSEFHPTEPIYFYHLGKALIATGNEEAGRQALLQCKQLNPPRAMSAAIDAQLKALDGRP